MKNAFLKRGSRFFASLAVAIVILVIHGTASADEMPDLGELPLERLVNTEIITAAKLAHQVSDAASAVSIVTADDIRAFGYRTLSDILNSMRGLNMSFDGEYGYLGGRGFGKPGEYADRITLLVDGYRAQESYFGQSFFGTDGLLDVELIERVEYIPGPGSSSYGNGAFLGVINVITRKGKDFGAPIISQEFGSRGWRKSRLTYGEEFENGLDLLFSVSDFSQNGRNIFGTAANNESERANRYFLKATYEGWGFESAWSDRPSRDVDDPNRSFNDTNSFANLRYDGELSNHLKLSSLGYWGRYQYVDSFASYWGGPWGTTGEWSGLDVKLVGTWFNRHTLVFGSEYRDDRQKYWTAPAGSLYARATDRQTLSFYAYDDIWLADSLQLNLGARQDERNNGSRTFSPRAAIIYTPWLGSTFKLSTGTAHRQATAQLETDTRSTSLPIERVNVKELVWEQRLGSKTRLISSLYRYRIDNRFDLDYGTFPAGIVAQSPVFTRGAEFELEHAWERGIRLRGSFTAQDAQDQSSGYLVNVPRTVAKLNLSTPIVSEQWRLAWGTRFIGQRRDATGGYLHSTAISDLTLSGKWQNCSLIVSARNIFDSNYRDVALDGLYSGTYNGLYPNDGRTYWVQFSLGFK